MEREPKIKNYSLWGGEDFKTLKALAFSPTLRLRVSPLK